MREELLAMINGAWTSQAIAVACELDIAGRLAAAPADAAKLAADTGTHAPSMQRFLRALCTLGVCEEREGGVFALGEAGAWLRPGADGSLHGWAVMSGRRLWALWSDLREGVRTGESVRRRRRGFDDFAELDADPAMAAIFNQAMISVTDPIAAALLERHAFRGITTAVDVGGGAGHLLARILAARPGMRGEVFDLAHARGAAEDTMRRHGVAERARFVEGSFFESLPAGRDAYLLKSVLHNWDDHRAVRILERCAAAMGTGSRLMVLERIVPEHVTASALDRDTARSDLQMLLGCDGRERTRAEFEALFREAGIARTATLVPLADAFVLLEL